MYFLPRKRSTHSICCKIDLHTPYAKFLCIEFCHPEGSDFLGLCNASRVHILNAFCSLLYTFTFDFSAMVAYGFDTQFKLFLHAILAFGDGFPPIQFGTFPDSGASCQTSDVQFGKCLHQQVFHFFKYENRGCVTHLF